MFNSSVTKTLIKLSEPDPLYEAELVQINPPKKQKPKAIDPLLPPSPESLPLVPEKVEYESPISWKFLLPPQTISYSATAEYVEKNPLFGRIPYVRFNHVKALRLTISNLRFITPCSDYDLLPLITSLQELMYPPKYIPPMDPELPVDEDDSGEEDTTTEEIEAIYARFPGGYPSGYPGASTGNPGGNFPGSGSEDLPTESQYPGGVGIPGGNQGRPGGQRPPGGGGQRPPGGGGQLPPGEPGDAEELPVEEIETDIEEEADKELKDDIQGDEPIADPRTIDPPMLALRLGKRVIQPIRLESMQVNENELTNGFPGDVTLNLTFVAITHPVLWEELLKPEDLIGNDSGVKPGDGRNPTDPIEVEPESSNDPFDTGVPIQLA